MNWNFDESIYPGPGVEPVGWATINDKQYPVYGLTVTSIDLDGETLVLTSPKTLANGDTLEFRT